MSRLHSIKAVTHLPALDRSVAAAILTNSIGVNGSAPRILLLCGSLHPHSRSQIAVEEAARLLTYFGAEPRIFDASSLPLPDRYSRRNSAVLELRALSRWSQGQVWCNAEHRGGISSLIQAQVDHLRPYSGEGPSSGRALAVMQVFNDSQPFKAANTLRLLGRKLDMLVVPSEVCLNLSAEELDDEGRMKSSAGYQQIADLMERLVRLTISLGPLNRTTQMRTQRAQRVSAKPVAAVADWLSPSVVE